MSIEGIAGCTTGPLELRLFYSVLSSEAIERFAACAFNVLLIAQRIRRETLQTPGAKSATRSVSVGTRKYLIYVI
jgi:hypothetical protein